MQSKTPPLDEADEKTYSHHALKALDYLVINNELGGVHIWTSADEGVITYTVEYGPRKITGSGLSSTLLAATGRIVLRHCPRCNRSKPMESFIARADNPSGRGNICSQCNREVVSMTRSALAGGKRKRAES